MARLDAATLAVLIRLAGDLGATLIGLYQAMGRYTDAEELSEVLKNSDDVWAQVQTHAQAALAEPK